MIGYDAFMSTAVGPWPPAGRPQRGGRRLGAGRPPSYREPLLRKTVTVPASYVVLLQRFGRGNLSDGIRRLVEEACDRHGRPWLEHTPPIGGAEPRT